MVGGHETDVFIFRAGEANGENFDRHSDTLALFGYDNEHVTVTAQSDGYWLIDDGAYSETIQVLATSGVNVSDFHFV
jgi:hypothetical protein